MLAPESTRRGRKPRRSVKKRASLGMRIVGPAAPESQVADSRDQQWEGVRSRISKMARRMNVPTEEEIKKRSKPKVKGKARKKRRRSIHKRAGVRSAPSSLEDEDDLTQFGRSSFIDDSIEPPFDFIALIGIYENSGSLRQNIDAMVTNVDGFGHHFTPVLDFTNPEINNLVRDIVVRESLEDTEDLLDVTEEKLEGPNIGELEKLAKRWARIAAIEKGRLESFFAHINPIITFTKLRRRTREDLELLGNAAWEVIRKTDGDVTSKIDQVYHVPFVNMRLIRSDRDPIEIKMEIRKDAIHFDTVSVDRFFRRFVRITGTNRTYYKEFGDPRIVSRSTGHFYETEELLREAEGKTAFMANELFHWKIRSPISAYGVPRWIGTLISVLGNRAAEEINFLYFDNKGMPPMVLLVSGGRVSESSVERIESYIEDRVKGRENFHKIMILEALPADADPDSGGQIEHGGRLRLDLKPLVREMQQDAMFQEYDQNNQIKIGRSFRQPPIMTGDTRDQNRSTAQVAKALAEEQVYQPERDDFDAVMDAHFLISLKIHFWRFRTNAPVSRLPNDLVANVRNALEAGAVTPNEMRGLLADAFSIELPHRTDDWAKNPTKPFLAAVKLGGFAGPDNMEGFEGGVGEIEGEEGADVDVVAAKRRRPTRASSAALALNALRSALMDEVEEAKDEWLSLVHQQEHVSVDG